MRWSKRFAVSRRAVRAPTASIEVLEDAIRIEVSLPWLLAKAAKGL
jgi:hypothetical protein